MGNLFVYAFIKVDEFRKIAYVSLTDFNVINGFNHIWMIKDLFY